MRKVDDEESKLKEMTVKMDIEYENKLADYQNGKKEFEYLMNNFKE